MNNQLLNKRIPTIFGIGLIVLGTVLTTIVLNTQTNFKSKASNSEEPQNLKITNISDHSFTVAYQTVSATTGSINYGKEKELGNTELDDLDREKGNLFSKNIHSITIRNLSPSTKYHLIIVSGKNTFFNNGAPYEVSTGPSISSPPAIQNTIKGKVILPNGTPVDQGIVYLSSPNSQFLSSIITKGGEFNFSLNSLRKDDLSSYFKPNEDTVFKLLVTSDSLTSTVLLSAKQINSIPTITLSNDYDFSQTNSVGIATKSAQSGSSNFPAVTTKLIDLKPQILTPKKDQTFTDQQPQFHGTSLPNSEVDITIHSEESIQTQITADSNGNWTYRPPNPLSPGAHTITIQTRKASGILTTLTQSFTVFAAGTQVSQSATPSATPTQKITPTLIPTSTPTPAIIRLTPTSTPKPFPSPTSPSAGGPTPTPKIIVLLPTITSAPTPFPTLKPIGLPPTGDSSALNLGVLGLVITAIGLLLFLFTRKGTSI